jgi:hypothetical protein
MSKSDSTTITDEMPANVHDLPSTEHVIKYIHAAAGFPAKSTWLKAINADFYVTWPMLTAKNVNKYFPESEETQKEHMRQKRLGVRNTNRLMLGEDKEISKIGIGLQKLVKQKQKDVIHCDGAGLQMHRRGLYRPNQEISIHLQPQKQIHYDIM